MKELITERIKEFVEESPLNCNETGNRYFEEPLVGFASAENPLFRKYKEVVGPFHLSPQEVFEASFGSGSWEGGTVISWVLPIAEDIRASNRREKAYPSRGWAHTRFYGEQLNVGLREFITQFLLDLDKKAIAPQLSSHWQEVSSSERGPASTWSERHAAYAAGLGTFSFNDGLITERGIAHRCGSLITDLLLEPSPRPYERHTEYCLYCEKNRCGACISRCPVGALSAEGHDKIKCREYTYGTISELLNGEYGVGVSGCGLCQTKVPCESNIP